MSGTHVFVLLIIFIVFASGLLRSWMANREQVSKTDEDFDEMLARIDALEERIHVLERIVTERDVDLKRQIDNL